MQDSLTTRGLFERMAAEPREAITLGELLDAFSERAFGVFLLVALLPAFLPLPAGAGAISGPLVCLAGLQLLAQAEHPWLPRWLQRRTVSTAAIGRLRARLARPLAWLERLSHPRWPAMIDQPLAKVVSGSLLLALGALLALPIPLTNYPFGIILLVFAIALIERDGRTLMVAWTLGAIELSLVGWFVDDLAAGLGALMRFVSG